MRTGEPAGPAVVVDPYTSGAMFPAAFAEHGVGSVAVLTSERPPGVFAASYRPQDFVRVIVFDGDLDRVAAELGALRPRCVVPGAETGVELADQLAARVTPEWCNVPELGPARRDKWPMAQAVAAAGLAVIPQICTTDPAEVPPWLEREGLVGHDLVVKPTKSAGTDGVVKVPGGVGWTEVFAANLGRTNQFGAVDEQLLVQKFITGNEYVIDTVTYDGRHSLVDVCRYNKIDNGPHMAVYDTMRWVPPDDPAIPRLFEYTKAALDAVGVRFGTGHVEIMDTAGGPVLIELAARPHGGGQPRFNQVATGDNVVARMVRAVVTGELRPDYRLLRHQVCVFHIARASGVVRNASVLDAVRELPSHHFSIRHLNDGDPIIVTRKLMDSLGFGFVILSHVDAGQVETDTRAIRELERALVIDEAVPVG